MAPQESESHAGPSRVLLLPLKPCPCHSRRVAKSVERMVRLHLGLTVIWGILIVPSVLWWRESVPWLVLMSAWANFASHWAAWQAARGERSTS